jgi:hypothetical protein
VSSIITVLIAGSLLLVAIAAMALVHAVTHTVEGYEDESGFHQIVRSQIVQQSQPTEMTLLAAEAARWDSVEEITVGQEQWMI